MEIFKTRKIQITKMHSSLDDSTQNFSSYEGFMHTDMESQELIIMNKKPVSNPQYVLLSDPQMVHEEKKKWLAEQEELRKKLEVEFHKKK